MSAAAILKSFNQSAIACNLSGRQMQLWLKLYEFISSYRHQDVQLYTPMLLDMLHISIRQFRRARQGLIDAGFLSIRQDLQQHTSYTLLLNGEEVALHNTVKERHNEAVNASHTGDNRVNMPFSGMGNPSPTVDYRADAPFSGAVNPSNTGDIHVNVPFSGTSPAQKNAQVCGTSRAPSPTGDNRVNMPFSGMGNPSPAGDIMLNGGYRPVLQEFCDRFADAALTGWLQQWADMRRKNGWTLTGWGFTALLDKLQTLAKGSVQAMTAIVRQSVTRGWKGFYPARVQSKPSGEALRRMEHSSRSGTPYQKFTPEQRDLSFLER